MTPVELYGTMLSKHEYQTDDAQHETVRHTQRLFEDLVENENNRGFFHQILTGKKHIRGLYLWGGTGRGKTWIVDSFYSCVPFKEKYRTHFHTFMRDIHIRLQKLQGRSNPLDIIAHDLGKRFRLLCLDEFHVHDIGDAMIMTALLRALYEQNITLVATSNIEISRLYEKGLQRELFLETIQLLKDNNDEVSLGDGMDYRFNALEKSGIYHIASDDAGSEILCQYLTRAIPCPAKHNRAIEINNRPINYRALADDIVWFDFDELCNTPRSDSDYIAIAERFHTVLVSSIRKMNEEDDNIAKRFIHLIDALYDHNVKCIFTAHDLPDKLYQGRLLSRAFKRTVSRLAEMDSKKYLKQPHLRQASSINHQ